MITKTTLTQLLNLTCTATNKVIEVEEVVKLHNWGVRSGDQVLGYGSFVWNESQREFDLIPCRELNDHYELENSLDFDRYDIFRTSPEKLNKEEAKLLNELT